MIATKKIPSLVTYLALAAAGLMLYLHRALPRHLLGRLEDGRVIEQVSGWSMLLFGWPAMVLAAIVGALAMIVLGHAIVARAQQLQLEAEKRQERNALRLDQHVRERMRQSQRLQDARAALSDEEVRLNMRAEDMQRQQQEINEQRYELNRQQGLFQIEVRQHESRQPGRKTTTRKKQPAAGS